MNARRLGRLGWSSLVAMLLTGAVIVQEAGADVFCKRSGGVLRLRPACKTGETALPISIENGGNLVVFSGANVQIVSGSGATDGPTNGTGNLIIGYNGNAIDGPAPERTGSHNLVVGDGHSYTSSSGLVAGRDNRVMAPSATVVGGYSNDATGQHSSILGGVDNKAQGVSSSIVGGFDNTAGGGASSILGGEQNSSTGAQSTIAGGFNCQVFGINSALGGGNEVNLGGDTVWGAGSLVELP